MVSPSARPEPEHRAADDAAAAEGQHDGADHAPLGGAEGVARLRARPRGACENTSRMIEQTIGVTISATTMPAMNVEEV